MEEEEEIILDPLLSIGMWVWRSWGHPGYEAAGEASSPWLVPKAIGEDATAQREQAA